MTLWECVPAFLYLPCEEPSKFPCLVKLTWDREENQERQSVLVQHLLQVPWAPALQEIAIWSLQKQNLSLNRRGYSSQDWQNSPPGRDCYPGQLVFFLLHGKTTASLSKNVSAPFLAFTTLFSQVDGKIVIMVFHICGFVGGNEMLCISKIPI